MDLIGTLWTNGVAFLFILTVVVFAHEMGHYLIARHNGVRVEVFSIGFGPELFGWHDRAGTRWKVSWIPFGGYVKMFGEHSGTESEGRTTAPEEEAVSFSTKSLAQRAAIIVGGPLANFVLAIVLLAGLFSIVGQRITPPHLSVVTPGSPAEEAGVEPGDVVVSIDGRTIDRFEQLQRIVRENPEVPLTMVVDRAGERVKLVVTPRRVEREDRFGNLHEFGELGVGPISPPDVSIVKPGSPAEDAGIRSGDVVKSIDGRPIDSFEQLRQIVRENPEVPLKMVVDRGGESVELIVTPRSVEREGQFGKREEYGELGVSGGIRVVFVRHDPLTATVEAVRETWAITAATVRYLGQIIAGTRRADDLGGPIRIAQLSGQVAEEGLITVFWFMAVLSINLGLINLFPIPVLDGGHLLFYAIEAVLGRPLGPRAQEYGFRIGLALVFTLMVFVTWNDLVHLRVVEFFVDLVS